MLNVRKCLGVTTILIAALLLSVGCVSQYVRSAKIYMVDKDWNNAKEQLEEGAKVTPEDAQLFHLLGKVNVELKDWDGMNVAFKRCQELSSDFARMEIRLESR